MGYCCQTLAGIAKNCGNSIGGIRRVWLGCFDTVFPTVTNNKIMSFTPEDLSTVMYLYEFRKQTGNAISEFNRDDTSGVSYWEGTITLQFQEQESTKRAEINALTASDLVAIVEDNNGRYWYYGYDNPLEIATGTNADTGTAFTDINGYSITINDWSKESPYEIDPAALDSLLNPTSV